MRDWREMATRILDTWARTNDWRTTLDMYNNNKHLWGGGDPPEPVGMAMGLIRGLHAHDELAGSPE